MKRTDIENLLDLDNKEIQQLYMCWDKGDCSLIGLARMLLIQEINKAIKIDGQHYDGKYDMLLTSLYNEYQP